MNKLLTLVLLFATLCSCKDKSKLNNSSAEEKPRIAIAGLGIESSTFSPARTQEEAFHARVGDSIFSRYPFFAEDAEIRNRAEWIPTFLGKALPGGVVTKEAYESMVSKTLAMLKENGPYDGLWFDIHGAMSVEGLLDAEGDLIKRIREVVGPDILISTSMDLHGNVSKELAHQSDLITCYRLAPHEDALESKARSITNLLNRLESGKGKPKYKAWIPVPILLPGEKTSTRIEPGKNLYAKIPSVESLDGVIDAAIWVGYAWADEPRNHAVVMAYGDDKEQVTQGAEKLAKHFWDVRHQFDFVAPTTTFNESLRLALQSENKPYIISDMGDNPTAGGAGDVTWTLREILGRGEFKSEDGPALIYASIPGPELIEEALKAGVGGNVKAKVGASVDDRYSPPIELDGKVTAIKKGDRDAEVEVVVKVGSVSVIVTKKRKPYHHERDFTNLNLNPRTTDILIVKIGYLVPELYDIRGGWTMALTPGGVDQDLERLGHENIKRPMFPLDAQMENPDLSARLIPLSNE
ncbi:M81 family metallopeptidase [Croceivirga thetidis]|uniref:M81 family metallopeptidase n=1 Tax=Croceivirga thetidis TaxID=2721623 RepID=A0ABX1GSZ3_9FLAO|nr:M81 family metallopeptidase [Croceivirga thetidis]NKI32763.1 M81 family metallopeptidase [Croceivirga thetidis]